MIACVRVPNFAVRLHLLSHPEQDGEPIVLTSQGERRRVIDCTPEATDLLIRPGMSLRDVAAMAPQAIAVATDPVRESTESQRVLAELETVSPAVEVDTNDIGCWYLDIAGLERLYGSPESIAEHLLSLMPTLLRTRVGIAGVPFAARVAAGRATPGSWLFVPESETRAFLATEPVTSLPAPAEQITLLRQLGFDTLGALAELPGSAVAARFGPAGKTSWQLARGIDPKRPKPRLSREVITERVAIELPTASRESLFYALRLLVRRASRPARLRGRAARQVVLRAVFEAGGSWERRFPLREPLAGDQLVQQLQRRLQGLELPQPVAELAIELAGLTDEQAHQSFISFFRERDRRPIDRAEAHLKDRYRTSSLHRVVPVEPWSRIPERQYALMPHDPGPQDTPQPLNLPKPVTVEARQSRRRKSEPVAVFEGKQRRAITAIEDRWYLDQEWWLRPIQRRYFRVLLDSGAARTLYHDLRDQQWYAQEYREEWP